MRKVVLSIVSLLFVLCLSVSPFAVSAEPTAAPDDAPAAAPAADAAPTAATQATLYAPLDQKGNKFEKIGATDQAELYMQYIEESGYVFALKNLKTGAVWYSVNPDTLSVLGDVPMFYNTQFELCNITYVTGILDPSKSAKTVTASSVDYMMSREQYQEKAIENGIQLTVEFATEGDDTIGFTIPMEITVVDDHMDVSVIFEGIKRSKACTSALLSVGVMKYMGAAAFSGKNYTLIPDGCGTLVYNDYQNRDDATSEWTCDIYGTDSILVKETQNSNANSNTLPVYGVKSGDKAMLAVASLGDGNCKFRSMGATTDEFSYAYFDFIYNLYDEFEAAVIYGNQKMYAQVGPQNSHQKKVTVSFYALEGADADYVGMAKTYREYLIASGAQSKVSKDVAFYLETVGCVVKPESSFGFIVDTTKEVTTFEQAADMVSALQKGGVKNINLRYSGWMKGGLETKPVTNANIDSTVGDADSLQALKKTVSSAGGQLFLNINVTKLLKTGSGYSNGNAAVRNALNEYAEQNRYMLNDGEAIKGKEYFLVTPSRLPEQVNDFLDDAKDYGLDALSIGDAGSAHYSDFTDSERFSDAQNTCDIISGILSNVSKDKTVMVDTGNAYTFQNADVVIGAPMYDSGYLIGTHEVPFLQIALHGVVTYTETAHNLTTLSKTQLLRELETGANPYYLLTNAEASVFGKTNFDYIVSSQFDVWKDNAISDYQTLASVLNGYGDQYITDHKILSKDGNVRATTYGDKLTVVVNYGNTDVKLSNGKTVTAEGYLTCRAGEV